MGYSLSFPSCSVVLPSFSIVFPSFSIIFHGFPMVFHSFHSFSMVFPWFSASNSHGSPRFPHGVVPSKVALLGSIPGSVTSQRQVSICPLRAAWQNFIILWLDPMDKINGIILGYDQNLYDWDNFGRLYKLIIIICGWLNWTYDI